MSFLNRCLEARVDQATAGYRLPTVVRDQGDVLEAPLRHEHVLIIGVATFTALN